MHSPPDPKLPPFERLVALMRTLRAPGGCAWDAKQSHQSLVKYLVEESYEVIDAISALEQSGDSAALREELGDLLTQFVFHGVIAEEKGEFTIDQSIAQVVEKLISRHPHVFGDIANTLDATQVRGQWEKRKLGETGASGERKRLLDGVPRSMPALTRAFRFGEKCGGVGYDWHDWPPVMAKVREELAELMAAIEEETDKPQRADKPQRGDTPQWGHTEEEIGDLLFVVASLSRKLGIDPETALSKSLDKFQRRFGHIEEQVMVSGKQWDEFTLEELDKWWDEAKSREKKSTVE